MTEQIIELDGKMYRIIPVETEPKAEPGEPERTGYERAKEEADYFSCGENGKASHYTDQRDALDDETFKVGNYNTDEALAKARARRNRLLWQLERFAVEHRVNPLDWNDTKPEVKYAIYFDHERKVIDILYDDVGQTLFCIYFDSEETAKAAIDEFHDELLWFFTAYRDALQGGEPR